MGTRALEKSPVPGGQNSGDRKSSGTELGRCVRGGGGGYVRQEQKEQKKRDLGRELIIIE